MAAALCIAYLAGSAAAAQEERPLERAIVEAVIAGKIKRLHAYLVIHRGQTLAEVYFDGEDERWGRRVGVVHHGPDTLHDVRSITKSITALLYGIALAEGKVPGPHAPLLAQFPQYADLAGDPLRDRITVGDALAMQMGTEWDENMPYTNPQNSEVAMNQSPDPDRYALDRPMIFEPGTRWTYNGGAASLIGRLIADGTGGKLDDYAREKLFEPLGIKQWEWARRPDGVPSAASGLRLTARDLAKVGQMVLAGGLFEGRSIVSREWLDEVFTPHTRLRGIRYGYFWWLADANEPRAWVSGLGNRLPGAGEWPTWMAGMGNGGQRLQIQPDIGLIVVAFAGDYNNPQDWVMPVRIIEEEVAAELRRRLAK
ncbi:MAG: serine hydrolase [Rhizobiales bacterium]|nr:serine hydrolase [Hyphomicrobiales bacterium]